MIKAESIKWNTKLASEPTAVYPRVLSSNGYLSSINLTFAVARERESDNNKKKTMSEWPASSAGKHRNYHG
jgi:hypothetical protein